MFCKVSLETPISPIGTFFQQQNHNKRALELARSKPDPAGESATLSNLGNVYTEQGKIDQATTLYQEALKIAQETRDRRLEGNIFNNLGLAYTKLDNEEAAKTSYEKALEIAKEIEDRILEGNILNNLQLLPSRLRDEDQINTQTLISSPFVDESEYTDNLSLQQAVEATTETRPHRQRTRFYILVTLVLSLTVIVLIFFILSLQGAISSTLSGIVANLAALLGIVLSVAGWFFPFQPNKSSEERAKNPTKAKR